MDELPIELNIITLNCQGTKSSPYREERLAAIGTYLATSEPVPHIVALQECFYRDDYLGIRRETRFALPFGKLYSSGAFGNGLAILSRWPIEESSMVPFALYRRPSNLLRGNKGIAYARIRYGEGEKDIIEVFNTQTHRSRDGLSEDPSDTVHRLLQAWEISKLVRGATERGHLAVVLASLNAVPFSLPYRLLTAHAPVRDAWRVLNPDSSLGPATHDLERTRGRPTPTAQFNVTENGVTSNSAYNTFAWSSSEQRALRRGKRPMLIMPETPDESGQRIDYVFFSRGGDPHASPTDLSEILSAHNAFTDDGFGSLAAPSGWVVKDARVGLTARHEQLGCSLSDRFSVETTLVLHTPTPPQTRRRRHGSPPRSSSPSPTRAVGPDFALSPASKVRSAGQSRDRGTISAAIRDSIDKFQSKGEKDRGRPGTPRSFTSTDAGLQTLGARAAAMEKGVYLQSPAASSFRRTSRDRALWDQQLDAAAPPRFPLPAYDEILELIEDEIYTAHRHRQFRIAHFLVWLAVVIGSYVGIWFLPNGTGAFALLVASSLGFPVGVLDLVIALLFHPSEIAKLTEFDFEIRNAKAVASGMGVDALLHQGTGDEWG
ncbi:DNase I-like protein [Xylariaceae sp. FL1272]|nr:DNase I-like protein [Xylariaceae sp. FL1272]